MVIGLDPDGAATAVTSPQLPFCRTISLDPEPLIGKSSFVWRGMSAMQSMMFA